MNRRGRERRASAPELVSSANNIVVEMMFTSMARQKCSRLMKSVQHGQGVSAQEMLEVAQIAAREVRGALRTNMSELLEVYGFLITTRANFGVWDAEVCENFVPSREKPTPPPLPSARFDSAIETISVYLGERIPKSGEVTSPFDGQRTSGKNLRDRLYQMTQHNGHPGAAIAFV